MKRHAWFLRCVSLSFGCAVLCVLASAALAELKPQVVLSTAEASVSNAKVNCGSPSVSGVSADVTSKMSTKAVFTVWFDGKAPGDCVKYEKQTCAPDALICPDKCVQSGPEKTVSSDKKDLTIDPGKTVKFSGTFSNVGLNSGKIKVQRKGTSNISSHTVSNASGWKPCIF
jgi:hypothetical protein